MEIPDASHHCTEITAPTTRNKRNLLCRNLISQDCRLNDEFWHLAWWHDFSKGSSSKAEINLTNFWRTPSHFVWEGLKYKRSHSVQKRETSVTPSSHPRGRLSDWLLLTNWMPWQQIGGDHLHMSSLFQAWALFNMRIHHFNSAYYKDDRKLKKSKKGPL